MFCYAHLETLYRNRAWVIVDGGPLGTKTVETLRQRFQRDWPPEHFRMWSKADFEEYYPPRFAERVRSALSKPHDDKREAKRLLLKDVLAWCAGNEELARNEFSSSAAEVVDVLREVELKLFPSS
jgi:hypothetical protein